jgi:putative iron-only hydrogenase system regulator
MDKRLGFVGIIIEDRTKSANEVNAVLFDFGEIILGRIGLPCKEKGCNVITLIVNADTDQIGSLTGRLGKINNISVKSALSKNRNL